MIFSSKTHVSSGALTDSFSRPGGKAAKLLGKSEQLNCVHIYKMRYENMLGRQSSGRSLQSIDKDEETSSGSVSSSCCSVSDDCQTTDSNDPGIEIRKLSQASLNKAGDKSPSLKPTRHMLVIPDASNNKTRVMEVNCRSSSLTFVDTPNALPLVCPSPDSGVHDDFHLPSSKNGSRIIGNLHSTSSPSILCDSYPKRCLLPASNILANKS